MSTTTPSGQASDYRILGVIGIGHGMSHLYYLVLPPIFVQLREAFGVSYAELGTALAVMSLASAIVQVPIGFLVDRLGARVVLVTGLVFVSMATALMGFATTFTQLLGLCVMSGIANAVFHPTDYAILNSSVSADRMGRAFSLHTFTGQLGSAAAPIVMIALAQAFGWRQALIIVGLAGFVAVVALLTQWNVMREDIAKKPKADGASRDGKSIGSRPAPASAMATVFSPGMLMFFVFFTVLSMMQTGMQSFAATALVALHDTPLATANLALSAFLFASAAGVLLGGEMADRTDRHDLIASIVFVASAVFCLALAVLSLPGAMLVTLMTLIGLGQGATRPARDMMLRAATPKGSAGSVFGFVTSGIAVGSALAPIPLGWLLDIGRPALVFYALAAFMVLALVAMYAQRALQR